MKNLLKTLKSWAIKAFGVLRAIEEGMEYRLEDYALDRLKNLEQRMASLDQERITPDSDVRRREHPEAISDSPLSLEGFLMTDKTHTQAEPSASTATGVFALLKAKPGVTREQVIAVMPAEIRATVQLYLDGKIREWHAREDGKGAIFLLNTSEVAEASAIIESLPLSKENLLDHEYIPVGPLMPLRLLLAGR